MSRVGLGKVINTESAFILAGAILVFGFVFRAHHPDAPYETLVTGIVALCGGFWWKRNKQQQFTLGNNKVNTAGMGKVDPLMGGQG